METLIKKISDRSGLASANVLNTKFSEVENRIPNTSSLVAKIVVNAKTSEVENKISDNSKYIIAPEVNC